MTSARATSRTIAVVFAVIGSSWACAGAPPPATSPSSSEPGPSIVAEPGPAPLPSGTVYGGSLPPAEVKKALAARRADVRQCYHKLLERDRRAAGKVVVRFTVGEDGSVEKALVMYGTTLPDDIAECIVDVVRTTKFAKPTEGKATIVYPWEFSPDPG